MKGTALVTSQEAAAIDDAAIKRALLGLSAIKSLGLTEAQIGIASRKPPVP